MYNVQLNLTIILPFRIKRHNYLVVILRARCRYKIDTRVAKAAKMINNSCPNYDSCCFHCDNYQRIEYWFINCLLFKNLHNKINNVKGYKNSSNNRINSICNIDILGNRKIVNRYRIYIFLISEREFLVKEEWRCLFKCQTESGTYSKSPFLLRSAALLNDIILPSRANADPITDPSKDFEKNNSSYYLFNACTNKNETIVKHLVEHGAVINKENNDGITPIFNACSNFKLKI
ncbi:hypothetical protein BCR32DRAFT_281515 [Anaeromyces robustus]|uniref:Uncharacterized protein n=1 Tax=Anaeromyces robustus TaxID=1754192 RepID=A0A1Y1X107_9FUNG|nr:hypothetical protein BCR32DRAFT_281515 [Anaeromyces robustus]|eukprot:ORX79345.1 hypothetical protein BCR32DRAFT_281515 [Anaeromyces robustus]